jgi:hypothetical protein
MNTSFHFNRDGLYIVVGLYRICTSIEKPAAADWTGNYTSPGAEIVEFLPVVYRSWSFI